MLGREWVVDGYGCQPEWLRSSARVRDFLSKAIRDLGLTAAQPAMVHPFPGEGGITALVLLTESHLAVHTFPEHGAITVNLYCCKERPSWDWNRELAAHFGAERVTVFSCERGAELRLPKTPAVSDQIQERS